MGLIYDVGDIVTLKKGHHVEARNGKSCEWV